MSARTTSGTHALAELDLRLGELSRRLQRLAERHERLEALAMPAPREEAGVVSPAAQGGYVVFVPSPGGYELVVLDGSPPDPGQPLELSERAGLRFTVAKVGPSPLPGDDRPCVYLQLI